MHINIVVLIELSEFYAYFHNHIHITLLFLDRLSEESIRGLISYAHLERIPSQIDRKSGYEVETVQYFFSELGIISQRNLTQNLHFEN